MKELALTELLAKSKLALRITTTSFDDEIKDLIKASFDDLCLVNASFEDAEATNYPANNNLIVRAIITYVKAYFGENEYAERYIKTYNELKAQLKTATGYTDWDK